ncbi:MAG: hypothetical protein JXR73_21840 [Candidatus Omnitrophica bacterium]|nr:hypothetical protein [Candidatus Omnitrophota bacterium]
MMNRWRWIVFFLLFLCMSGQGAPQKSALNIPVDNYIKSLESIQNDENTPTPLRDLAEKAVNALRTGDLTSAMNHMDRIVAMDSTSDAAFESRLILTDASIWSTRSARTAKRQFLAMPYEHKQKTVESFASYFSDLKKEKNPLVRQAAAEWFLTLGEWAKQNRRPGADAVYSQAASMMPEQSQGRIEAYRNVIRTTQKGEEREDVLFQLAKTHLDAERYADALITLRRIQSAENLKKRMEEIIAVCRKNPDSLAALRELKTEQMYCPPGAMRCQFDIAVAQIYLREEMYDQAEQHLLAADSQYSYAGVIKEVNERYQKESDDREKLREKISDRVRDLTLGKKAP